MDPTETSIYHTALMAAGITAVFIIVFLGFSLWLQRQYHKRSQKRIETEVMVLEKERARIAADIHDDIGPVLFSAKRRFEALALTDTYSVTGREQALKLLGTLEIKLKNLSLGLMPLSLQKRGLQYAIEEYIFNLLLPPGLEIKLEVHNLPPIEEAWMVHIFRIIQEIIQNAIKHSGASLLYIKLQGNKNILTIATADNGKGFNFNKTISHNGYGLYNIRSRANYLNARFSEVSVKGCKYEIVINCAAKNNRL